MSLKFYTKYKPVFNYESEGWAIHAVIKKAEPKINKHNYDWINDYDEKEKPEIKIDPSKNHRYYIENREDTLSYKKRYRAQPHNKIRAANYMKEYVAANKEQKSEYMKDYYQKNRDRILEYNQKRMLKKLNEVKN